MGGDFLTTKDMFSKECMILNLKATSKQQVLEELTSVLAKNNKIENEKSFLEVVLKRENECSTGIGMGIAIPHGKSDLVKETAIVFGRSEQGIDYDSIDEEPAFFFFLIAVQTEASNLHLKALSDISRKLMHAEIREKLRKITSFEEFIEIFE